MDPIHGIHDRAGVTRQRVLGRPSRHRAVGQRVPVRHQGVLVRRIRRQPHVLVRISRRIIQRTDPRTVSVNLDKRVRAVHGQRDRGCVLVAHHVIRQHGGVYQGVHIDFRGGSGNTVQAGGSHIDMVRIFPQPRIRQRIGWVGHRLERRPVAGDRDTVVRALQMNGNGRGRHTGQDEIGNQLLTQTDAHGVTAHPLRIPRRQEVAVRRRRQIQTRHRERRVVRRAPHHRGITHARNVHMIVASGVPKHKLGGRPGLGRHIDKLQRGHGSDRLGHRDARLARIVRIRWVVRGDRIGVGTVGRKPVIHIAVPRNLVAHHIVP